MLSALVCFFSIVGLLNGKLADVVVDSLLAKGSTLEKADIVERSRIVIRGGVRLTPISYNVLHQFYSSHGLQENVQYRDAGCRVVVSKKSNS